MKSNRFEQARAAFIELTTLRRLPDDWLLLSDCEKALGNGPASIRALEMAVRINPRLTSVHQILANHFRRAGDAAKSDWHHKRAAK